VGLTLLTALIFTAIMILMILKMGDAGRIFNDIPALVGYAAFSVFFFQIGTTFLPPLKRFFLWAGGFSYSLYLVHILVLEVWLRALAWLGVSVSWLSLLPFLAPALLAGRAFEPLSRWWVGLFKFEQ
jgi:peptidoglycan/LPS O-acetylase OafA/YrhL